MPDMLHLKHAWRTAALLCLLGAVPLFAQDGKEESLWGYADPAADICIYINTTQAEKAMEKGMWDQIQKEKNAAIEKKAKAGGQLFDTKDRDMELIGNLHITSVEPFSGTVDGVANITGDLTGDIQKMMEQMKEGNSGASPQMSKQDDLDFYTLALSGADGISGMDIMLVPVKPNQIQFRANLNSKDGVPKTLLGKAAEPSPAIAKYSGQDLSFACIMSPEKIAQFKLGDDAEKLVEFLKQMNEIAVSVRIAGKQMILDGSFSFKAESSVPAFVAIAEPFLSQVKSVAHGETPPRITTNGRVVGITVPVSISDAWGLLANMTGEPDEKEVEEAMKKADEAAEKKKEAEKE